MGGGSNIHATSDPEEEPCLLQQILHDGSAIPAHEGHPLDTPPPWLDMDKFTRGQQFAQKYLVPVLIGNFFAMMGIFVWKTIYRVVLLTRNLETIRKSGKRNFTTMVYIKSWYEGDLWDPTSTSYQNMKKVHRLHTVAATAANQNPEEMETVAANMELERQVLEKCNSWKLIREFMTQYRAPMDRFQVPAGPCYVSQMDHVITVLGIISPVLLSPEKLGIHGHTKADLEGFVHMWRVLSYHLGIQDRYNPCSGNLYMVQTRCQEMMDGIAYPAFASISQDQEYIMRLCVEGILKKSKATSFLSFDVMFMFMTWVYNDLDISRFYGMTTWHAILRFWILRFIVNVVVRLPLVLPFLNHLMRQQAALYSVLKEKIP